MIVIQRKDVVCHYMHIYDDTLGKCVFLSWMVHFIYLYVKMQAHSLMNWIGFWILMSWSMFKFIENSQCSTMWTIEVWGDLETSDLDDITHKWPMIVQCDE